MNESHQFKNLTFNTRHDRVAGLGNSEGSQKALNMLFAIRTIQERTGKDLGATFLSRTTISNSPQLNCICCSVPAPEGAGTAGYPVFRRLGGDIRQEDDGFWSST